MHSIYTTIGNKTKWRYIVVLYAVQIAIFQIMIRFIFPVIEQGLGSSHVLDMVKQGYDGKYVTELISLMSETSRNMYLHIQMPLDFLYPLIMSIVYFLIFTKVWRKHWYVFCVLPLVLVAFDWGENICIILMFNHSDTINRIASVSSFFTQAKSIVGDYILYNLALLSLILAVVKFLKDRYNLRSK